jgi:metal-sulfur cluster biosynthetic enzyme
LEEVTRVVAEGLGIQNEQVTIEFVFDPPWTQDMMNEEAIAELGLE